MAQKMYLLFIKNKFVMKANIFISTLILLFISSLSKAQYNLPEIDWQDSSAYAKYQSEVLHCIDWAYNTPVTSLKNARKSVNTFLGQWIAGSPDVNATFIGDVLKCNDNNLSYIFLYGWTKYTITSGDKDQLSGALQGIDMMISFYDANATALGKNKQIKKLKAWKAKGKLEKHIQKNF